MRKIFFNLFVTGVLFASCSEKCEKQDVADVYCFVDVTDTVNIALAESYFRPGKEGESGQLWNYLTQHVYKFDNCTGGKFRLYKINDVGENQYLGLSYPKEGYFSADKTDYQIKDDPAVKEFRNKFSGLYDNIVQGEGKEKRTTKIFLPVCKALNQLKESNASRKIVLIFSDMLENSDKFSFYKNKEINAEKTLDNLEAIYNQSFPALNEIEVYIVSKRNTSNDIGIDKAEKFWKSVFTELYPAKVFRQGATLDIQM